MKHVTDKINLIHSVRRVTIIIFAIGVLAFTVVGLLDQYTLVKNETKKIRSEYTDKQKQIVKTQVENTVLFINLAKKTGISREDTIESVRKIRFGKDRDGYIFINTFDGISLLLDTQNELEGKDLWELTDPNGVKVIQEEWHAAQNPNGDFIYYSWNQPST
ncbi:MAG: cache domain-containing protein, partial [Spirochaetales bacterium]|nr:cache domain-containing protein [Spirochaetales bacterium]